MGTSKSIVAMSSPSETLALPQAESEAESQLSSLIFDLSQQVNGAMEDMLKMINDFDQSSTGIIKEIEKSKESAIERKKILEEDRERFQRAAYTVLDMFNNRENN